MICLSSEQGSKHDSTITRLGHFQQLEPHRQRFSSFTTPGEQQSDEERNPKGERSQSKENMKIEIYLVVYWLE